MVKKYKLLKDLPGLDAGTLINADSICSIPVVVKSPLRGMHLSFPTEMLELYTEWFEEVNEPKWTDEDMFAAFRFAWAGNDANLFFKTFGIKP